jgi:hypothetical protein
MERAVAFTRVLWSWERTGPPARTTLNEWVRNGDRVYAFRRPALWDATIGLSKRHGKSNTMRRRSHGVC